MSTRAGFIGLGRMGLPMAEHIARAGLPIVGYDRQPDALRRAAEAGIGTAGSPAELAEASDIVVTMLPGPPEIEEAMLGDDGVVSGLKPGAVWVDMSTSDAETASRVARHPAAAKLELLDAPVTGGVKGAEAGSLKVFVGGEASALAKCEPLLEAMAADGAVLHVGPKGAGYAVKLCMQLLFFAQVAAVGEVLSLGARAGVDVELLHEALVDSGANSRVLEADVGEILGAGDYRDAFRLALATKDIALGVDLARGLGLPVELCGLVEQIHRRALAEYGDGGQLLAVRLMEDLAGVRLRVDGGAQ